MRDRHCEGTNRAGQPCRAAPLRDGQWCSAHEPKLPAAIRFGSSEQAAGAATGVDRRTPSVTEQMRERVEAEAEAILAPYFEALAEGQDIEQRMRAAERLLDRVFGRPKQSTQPGGRATGRTETYDLSSELDRALEEMLAGDIAEES